MMMIVQATSANRELSFEEIELVSGGRVNLQGLIPGYPAPTVIYDDGINILTTDPTTSNVVVNVR
jgi:hypothetical protein